MPRPSKGPRIYERRRKGRAPVFTIRDGGHEEVTGAEDRRQADLALARYIERTRGRSRAADRCETVADVLDLYGVEHAPTVAAPERIGYAIKALLPFWGDRPVSDVTPASCRAYRRERGPRIRDGTVRKELGVLATALAYAARVGAIGKAPAVELPPKPPPKDRWLTRPEAARLLWAAWRSPKSKHLARFILIGLYTGTRRDAILGLRLDGPHVNGGWIDLERGRLHRIGSGERATKKRRGVARCSRRLLAHARRWRRLGATWAVEIEGARVGSIKTAWRNAVERAQEAATLADEDFDFSGVTPHTLRRTTATWAMQRGEDPWEVAGFLSMTRDTLETIYAQHHPDFQESVAEAVTRQR